MENLDYFYSVEKRPSNKKMIQLGKIISPLKPNENIPKGTLVCKASGDTCLRFKIVENELAQNRFTSPLKLNIEAAKYNISPEYLLAYFGKKEISSHLLDQAKGAVFLKIPKKLLHGIGVELPIAECIPSIGTELVLKKEQNPLSNTLSQLYVDYEFNLKHKRYTSAIIIAGAMTEAILYQVLLDQDFDQKILSYDKALSFGKMISYLKVLELDKDTSVPIPYLIELHKKINATIRKGCNDDKRNQFELSDFTCFNKIISYFGI